IRPKPKTHGLGGGNSLVSRRDRSSDAPKAMVPGKEQGHQLLLMFLNEWWVEVFLDLFSH
ncbi:MAG: hypothetical protein KDF65_08720, partial [Anaerolineae bacterium]|nr:hypothetical protein [Anaerolineae bacterium]